MKEFCQIILCLILYAVCAAIYDGLRGCGVSILVSGTVALATLFFGAVLIAIVLVNLFK